ncbi:acyl-CoA synthetase [Microlunatus endophyticus]|uniref:Acyl-CoA synthetase n=1 Tax=Microlunatus endophyticus TaxID=1716077 RepID=A0A917SIB4_9ACTN|nr:TIGR03089 family protein [Microlunatus endophyticus]GGL81730.1 acyl-CoA synthetase [Microlunatus endophyticus]
MTEVFTAQLQRRNARSGSVPLITYYDESRGERVELSGISFANWVDKTAGLLTDEILLEPGDRVRLTLASAHPAHWVTLVWVAAIWRARGVVTLDPDDEVAAEVVGPDDPQPGPTETIACSLHPFGLGFSSALPAGVLDYGVEVRTFPDSFTGPHPSPEDPAWRDGERRLSQVQVVAGAGGDAVRRLVGPEPASDPWATIARALIEPVVTGGSAVVVVGADPARWSAIATAEHAVDH